MGLFVVALLFYAQAVRAGPPFRPSRFEEWLFNVKVTRLAPVERLPPVERLALWARFWRGPLGRWVFKAAGWGLKREPLPAGATRPTELALGSAADALFQVLPKETRRALSDLPKVVRRLEEKARLVRGRVEELDRLIAEASRGVRAALQTEQRKSLVADLEAARDAAQVRQGQVVAALEAIRLDLLRLRAGVGSVESITADLTAAREVGEQTERLLQAGQEVAVMLSARATPAAPAAPPAPARSTRPSAGRP
jgi:hypothetical protein